MTYAREHTYAPEHTYANWPISVHHFVRCVRMHLHTYAKCVRQLWKAIDAIIRTRYVPGTYVQIKHTYPVRMLVNLHTYATYPVRMSKIKHTHLVRMLVNLHTYASYGYTYQVNWARIYGSMHSLFVALTNQISSSKGLGRAGRHVCMAHAQS